MYRKKTYFIVAFLVLFIAKATAVEKKLKPKYHRSSVSSKFIKTVNNQQGLSVLRADLPDTMKILALRVQFQPDNDRTTTGNGLFDLSEPDSIVINSPPHNRKYFINQLKALKNYYESVSRGKLVLQIADEQENYFVYPLESDSAWSLPHQMAYYNPNAGDEALDRGLAELFRDAIQEADKSGGIDFSQFDAIIIFHAGVGWEFSQEFDTTPSDIPSVFLNIEDLRKNIGNNDPAFQGIPVNNGSYHVKEGIILPETESQGGVEIAMLGTEVIMFGHQLGLPNLFDTDTGRPGIGQFGIMDQGSGSFSGFIPVQPCAWSKIFLGWEDPITIYGGENIEVAAALTKNPNKIYKIPINSKEYFLIENRQRNVLKSRAVAVGYDEYGNRIEFNDNGEIILPAGISKLGVVTQIDEYDFGLPGSGIVIWHIDESVIEKGLPENRVNVDMQHRGVDVVEADGAQDIGYFFNFFGITGFNSGSAYDFWWSKNEDHLWANQSEKVEFTPNTMPNSNAYSGAKSGIYITNFSDLDSVMIFDLEIKHTKSGFPAYLGAKSGQSHIVSADLDGDGSIELLAATETGKILAWRSDESPYFPNQEKTVMVKNNGDTVQVPLPVFARVDDAKFSFPVSISDVDQNGIPEIAAACSDGRFFLWSPRDTDGDGYADLSGQVSVSANFSTPPLVSQNLKFQFFCGSEEGKVFAFNYLEKSFTLQPVANSSIVGLADLTVTGQSGMIVVSESGEVFRLDDVFQILWQVNLSGSGRFQSPAIADIDRDGKFEVILSTDQGDLFVLDDLGNTLPQFSGISLSCPLSSPAIADLNHDGYPDIVLTGAGKIFAFQYNGTALTNFPITFANKESNEKFPAPVIADLEGDNFPEIFVGTRDGKISVFDINGGKIDQFPLSISDTLSPAISLGSVGSGKFAVFGRSGDDYAYLWELDFDFNPQQLIWCNDLKDEKHNPVYTAASTGAPESFNELLPAKKVYNYPNPVQGGDTYIRYYLNEDAQVSIRIYDAAGEFVEEIAGTGYGGIDNEVTWNVENVQSGVYLARVHAKSSNKSESVIIKIAVMK